MVLDGFGRVWKGLGGFGKGGDNPPLPYYYNHYYHYYYYYQVFQPEPSESDATSSCSRRFPIFLSKWHRKWTSPAIILIGLKMVRELLHDMFAVPDHLLDAAYARFRQQAARLLERLLTRDG